MNINISPNITILFQIINFIIAYVLLRFLLFKPAYAVIKQEQKERDDLHNTIAHQKGVLAYKEQEIKDRWRECQEHFLHNKPSIDEPELYIFKHITPPLEQVHIAPDIVSTLIKDVRQSLIKKVE